MKLASRFAALCAAVPLLYAAPASAALIAIENVVLDLASVTAEFTDGGQSDTPGMARVYVRVQLGDLSNLSFYCQIPQPAVVLYPGEPPVVFLSDATAADLARRLASRLNQSQSIPSLIALLTDLGLTSCD